MPTIRSHKFNENDFIRIVNESGLLIKKANMLYVVDGINDSDVHWGNICASYDVDTSELCLYAIESFMSYEQHAGTQQNIVSVGRKIVNYDKSLEEQLREHLNNFVDCTKLYKKLIRYKNLSEI